MSEFHCRFEALESRFLLSSTGLVGNSFADISTKTVQTTLSETVVESQRLPATEIEYLAEDFQSPTNRETPVEQTPVVQTPVVQAPVVQAPSEQLLSQQSMNDSEVKLSSVSLVPIANSSATLSTSNITSATADIATKEMKEKESVSAVSVDTASVDTATFNTTSTRNTTQTLTKDTISVDNSIEKVTVNTSTTSVTIAESNATTETTERETPITSEANDADRADKQEADKSVDENKDKTPVQADAKTGDNQPSDLYKMWLAVEQESNAPGKAVSAAAADNDADAKPQQQAADKADGIAAIRTQATVTTNSPLILRQASDQTDQGNPLATAADHIYSEEQSDSDGRLAVSRTLPSPQGALLLVTLGQPLSRLAGGNSRVDVVNMDCGSPTARTSFDRSRRNRRKAAEARERWQRRGDVKDLTWFPPQDLANEIPPQPMESDQARADDPRSAAKPIAPRLADLAIAAHLDVCDKDNSSKSSESRTQALPALADWDGYAVVGTTSVAALSATISVLAVDRYRRNHAQERRIKFPLPVYTGRTLARV